MYWEQDQEITLLWSILEPLDSFVDSGTADQIICSLIDMELVNCHKAPVAQQAWQDKWEGFDVSRDFIAKHYKDTDDDDD